MSEGKALNFSMLDWQREVMNTPKRFKVVAAGRRTGKSRLAAVTLLINGLQCPKGASVIYVAPTQQQARMLLWDLLMDLGRDVITASHINNLTMTLVNGAKIYLAGSDRPDTLRGLSLTYLVLDECADVKEEVWEKVLRASLSDRKGAALFIGTPRGRNWFYDLYQLGLSGEDEEWQSWHFTTADNPLIDAKEIEAAKKTLSTFAFNQEYLADFNNTGTDTFKEEWLKEGPEPKHGSFYIAIDLAGFENIGNTSSRKNALDKTAIAVVKATDDGNWWVKKIEAGRWDIKETAQRILKNIVEFRPLAVGIERGSLKNAVLPYLSDLMRANNTYCHIQDLTHGNRKKSERIVWALQGRMENGKVTLNENEDWKDFRDEYLLFPTPQVHDDLIDALSYIDQLAVTTYFSDEESEQYEPLDLISGY